ncbi:MAG: N-acetylmuramoyl-L-alanine amidase [Bacillus sp. (in: Bacteria)]|nr:N-acetylmuramoyl-L-alanine amidase [Bacillus sp. (in: firmicutes)]MCM1427531.1 N-acetylmuramoyl-L-alanine amidase [Eubacterium sp.]
MEIIMQQNQLMKKTAVYTLIFALCAFAAIFYYSSHKVIIVENVAQDEVVQNEAQDVPEEEDIAHMDAAESAPGENSLLFEEKGQEMSYFCIPLHANVKAENVTIENHYMDKELWVSIKQAQQDETYADFYDTQALFGNREAIVDGHYENGADAFRLKFRLTDIYEYHSILENGNLYIEFIAPKEAYDRIVVIDPAYGDEITGAVSGELESKQVTLAVARALKKKLDETEIKVYYTRMDDSNPTEEERIDLTNAVKADMMIRIEVNENEDTKIYGTEAVYNSKFFIPGFGSIELADLLEREVVTAISGKANGLVDSTEEDIVINRAVVPAAAIRVGYISNGQEAILLNRDDYIEKIADGIYQAIMAAYE